MRKTLKPRVEFTQNEKTVPRGRGGGRGRHIFGELEVVGIGDEAQVVGGYVPRLEIAQRFVLYGFEVTNHVENQPSGLCLSACPLSEAATAAHGTAQGFKCRDRVVPQSRPVLSQHMGSRRGLGHTPVPG